MKLPDLKPRRVSRETSNDVLREVFRVDETFDYESWEILSCWKEQLADRFGAGTNAPNIPRSQRQYDGDNQFEYCEILVAR